MKEVLVLMVVNIVAHSWGWPLRELNVMCFLGFLFFIFSLSPASLFGFAMPRDWARNFFRRKAGCEEKPTDADYRKAAAKSLAVLTAVFLFGFSLALTRHEEPRFFLQSMAIMTGAEAGIVVGYLIALRFYSERSA